MSPDDARVVAWQYRLNNSDEGWSLWADCSQSNYEMMSLPRYKGLAETRVLVDESLLAEAEKLAESRRVSLNFQVDRLIDMEAQRDSLQSRLDAVVGLADRMEGIGRANWTHPKRKKFAAQIRSAALGGE